MVQKIALLYQALPPPVIGGLRKDKKPGGYSDSGADIAFTLQRHGHHVLTSVTNPNPINAFDWVFPDTIQGMNTAIQTGATILWANTVLFDGHPIQHVMPTIRLIGQCPIDTQRYDDKFTTNLLLKNAGLSVAHSFLVGKSEQNQNNIWSIDDLSIALKQEGLMFPVVVKPVRGRGSQGISIVHNITALTATLLRCIKEQKFGNYFMVEEFLDGQEMTLTIMPPTAPSPFTHKPSTYWALRPVHRFNQQGGIAPYNGDVPVSQNSKAIHITDLHSANIQTMVKDCVQAAQLIHAKAPIRIDCRADHTGRFKLFDLNMKPNMTGAGRPGREQQDCLTMIAARADGWDFIHLLQAILATAW